MLAVLAALITIGFSTSCQRQGCPNNFSLTEVAHELVQEIIQ